MDASTLAIIGATQCAGNLPIILVWLVCAALIGTRMSRNRAAAALGIGGIAVGFLEILLGAASVVAIPMIYEQGRSATQLGMISGVLGIVRAIVTAISWGLVLTALIMALGKPDAPEGIGGDRG